ncbi:unnamed protein product [Moneuplotes crassus]|uniref:RING-type domain-containing protein n=1 Tax=Euplotes crassus TaxID=5936 RepID=A0AAD1XCN6_EUPCR|nr:unnamed protein product [Moneuplotes crassus]
MEPTPEPLRPQRERLVDRVMYCGAAIVFFHFVVGSILVCCYGCDVHKKHTGISAKFLILFTSILRLCCLIPCIILLLLLFKKGCISLHLICVLNLLLLLLYLPWAIYLSIKFFSDDNHTRREAKFLYGALLYLMIEGFVLVLIFLILIVVYIVIFLINKKNSPKNDICCVCHEELTDHVNSVAHFPCNESHFGHKECVSRWIREKKACPICNSPINEATERVAVGYNTFEEHSFSSDKGKSEPTPDPNTTRSPFIDAGRTSWRQDP